MRIITASFTLALLSFTMACPATKPVTPVPDASDASQVGDALRKSDCASACIRLQSLGCPEGQPSDSGDSCQSVCEHSQTSKQFDMKPQCIVDSKTVDDVRVCGQVCKKK